MEEMIKVKISSKKTLEMSRESVIASLVNQFLTKTSPEVMGDQYFKLFQICSKDVEQYLDSLDSSKPFNIFNDWMDDFSEFKSTAAFSIMKEVCIKFSDGSVYAIPIIDVLYLLESKDKEISYEDFLIALDESSIESDDVVLSRTSNELDWEAISQFAMESKSPDNSPDYATEFKDAEKNIEIWKLEFDEPVDESEEEPDKSL
jgi:hypothetical protein